MKRNLVGQFSKRKHYKLPACIKPILLYYYAGVGLIASLYLIGLSLPLIWDEIKTNIKNEKITIIYSRGGAVDRDSAVNRQTEQIGGEISGADECSNTIEVSGGEAGDKASVSLEDKIKAVFPEEPDVAVAIARAESGLNPATASYTDYTSDGKPFSFGLFQINLSVHEIEGVACHTAFEGKNYKSKVINEQLYNQCVALASDIDVNLRKARKIYDSRGWNAWGAFTNKSFLKKL